MRLNQLLSWVCLSWIMPSLLWRFFHKLKSPTYKHQGFMALMLYMKKAYDRVEWSYIHSMMISLGFLSLCISLIINCLTTVIFCCFSQWESFGEACSEEKFTLGQSTVTFFVCYLCLRVISSSPHGETSVSFEWFSF